MQWTSFASHGYGEIVNAWITAAFLEEAVIHLYRDKLIEDPVGEYSHQLLKAAFASFITGPEPKFAWADSLSNYAQLEPIPDPLTHLAQMSLNVTKYRYTAHEERCRVLRNVHGLFISVSTQNLETRAPVSASMTSEVSFAFQALYMYVFLAIMLQYLI